MRYISPLSRSLQHQSILKQMQIYKRYKEHMMPVIVRENIYKIIAKRWYK